MKRLCSPEDQFSHEIAHSFFLFDGNALELRWGGREPVKDEVIIEGVRIVDVFFLIILPSDTYTCFRVEELLSVCIVATHMIILCKIQRAKNIIAFDSIKHEQVREFGQH